MIDPRAISSKSTSVIMRACGEHVNGITKNETLETRRIPVASVKIIIPREWLQGGWVESQKKTMDAQKQRSKETL